MCDRNCIYLCTLINPCRAVCDRNVIYSCTLINLCILCWLSFSFFSKFLIYHICKSHTIEHPYALAACKFPHVLKEANLKCNWLKFISVFAKDRADCGSSVSCQNSFPFCYSLHIYFSVYCSACFDPNIKSMWNLLASVPVEFYSSTFTIMSLFKVSWEIVGIPPRSK